MKDVLVKLKGTQETEDGEKNKIELVTEGKFYEKNDSYYLLYDESEISGLENSTTSLKIKQDEVSMKRFGDNNSKMEFKKNYKYNTLYSTIYGNLDMEVSTQKIQVDIKEGKGKIFLKYKLLISNNMESLNTLDITIS
ncbi:DUF1934 domain-containing protein [Senegalia massiliensis]|uniref:DUF1934 domain-containing protein n=1 Tax=Senegalia massiliensis TaxID=1720316 RepID=A0A845QVG8_9CLOT|nr:DUF1934 domain-containing protein [Senegalia massiliensis]NBI06231.1 DUF1934 domain-containing protein [Senegalia massiliensis]